MLARIYSLLEKLTLIKRLFSNIASISSSWCDQICVTQWRRAENAIESIHI